MITAGNIYNKLIRSFKAKPCRGCEYSDKILLEILSIGLEAADPTNAVYQYLSRDGSKIYLDEEKEKIFPLDEGFYLVGFGKAVAGMTKAFIQFSGKYIKDGYVIVPKTRTLKEDINFLKDNGINVLYGGFPMPNNDTITSSSKILDFIGELDEEDRLVVLISGGGSSLFELPLNSISLDDLVKAYYIMMIHGLNVKERATVKKHLSRVKGGRLASYIYPRKTVSLIISSVFDDDISAVASGPTAPDPTTYEDAKNILNYYKIWKLLPTSIERTIMGGIEGELPETPKPGELLFNNIDNVLVGSGRIGLRTMKAYSESKGYNVFLLTSRIEGEAREIGKVVGTLIEEIYRNNNPVEPPAVLLIGGETTVNVRGDGIGGRNQELLLPLIRRIKGMHGVSVVAFNTDGKDGISPAGGAIIDGCTMNEVAKHGLSIEDTLERNDSYTFFNILGRDLTTGDTGTDVNDYIIALISI